MKRTDVGRVSIVQSSVREKDYLIRNNEQYRNIESENVKLDYIAKYFSFPKKQ